MKAKLVVFDFDKTLTYQDTLLGFYWCASTNPRKMLSLPLYFFFMVLHKIKFINNDLFKKMGVLLFLTGLPLKEVIHKSKSYAQSIRMNSIYNDYFQKVDNYLVISAGFEEYLSYLFPEEKLIAAKLSIDKNGIITGLKRNCYGNQKVTLLKEKKITFINTFFTDSYSDKPCMDIAHNVYFVENDKAILIKGNAHPHF